MANYKGYFKDKDGNSIVPAKAEILTVDDIVCKNVLNKYLLMSQEAYTVDLGNNYKGYKLQLNPNTTYTLSIYYNDWVMSGAWIYRLFDSNKNSLIILQSDGISSNDRTYTFTTNSTGIVYFGSLYGGHADRLPKFLSTIDIQLEEGLFATTVAEHKEFSNKQIYSTEEQMIGTWKDGKTLYRKTININMPNGVTQRHNLYDTGLNNIITRKIYGVMYVNANVFPLPMYNLIVNESCLISAANSGSSIDIELNCDFSNYTADITIEYTKTTD